MQRLSLSLFALALRSRSLEPVPEPEPVPGLASPLVDGYLRARYTQGVADAQKYSLIRKQVDLNTWVDTSFLDQVLKEEHLENYWPPRPVR